MQKRELRVKINLVENLNHILQKQSSKNSLIFLYLNSIIEKKDQFDYLFSILKGVLKR